MNIIIYTGLSLPFNEAKKILDAEYMPPVKRDDLTKLLDERNDIDIIGIIDGVFHQSPAVSHKEIIRALENGITVVGGSSMGALRACELYPYGMIGIGHIFEDYKNGVIESDDDVAVSLNPDTLEQMSESLINMRYNFTDAVEDKIIDEKDMKNLLSTAKETYYPRRSFHYVIKKSSINDEKKEALLEYINENKYDIKTMDAIKVIEYIKNLTQQKNH